MIDVLNQASAERSGVFIFHSHSSRCARMSGDDLESARKILPKFQLAIPARPHGSIVFGEESVAGLILMPAKDSFTDKFTLRMFQGTMLTWPLSEASPREHLRFTRQPLALGQRVSERLGHCKIGVVGQSGGGTHVTQQLLQLGVGEIVGIDDDRVQKGNRFAGVGIGEKDIAVGRLKVDAVRRNLARLIPSVRYRRVSERFPERKALEALKRVDVIVGCVNNLHARADIQEAALRYIIPYVDIGLTLIPEDNSTDEFPPIRAVSGNIFTFTPGGPCLWCSEFLTDHKLEKETERRGRPYLKNPDNADALVVSFNGLLASQAVTEVLQLLTGFAPPEATSVYKKFDGLSGKLWPWSVKKNDHCSKCNVFLGVGDLIWESVG